jgi:tRNA(fMet)-specific endonuclease VapC
MTRTLVDTDILSDFLRGKNARVVDRANAYLRDHGRLSISVISVFEIVRGRHQANQIDRALKFVEWTKNADVLGFDAECARLAGEIGGALLRSGLPVGVADVLIAATAIAHRLVLATANVDHYERMRPFGLSIENWREET